MSLIGSFMLSLRMLTYRKSEIIFVFAPQTGKFEHYRMEFFSFLTKLCELNLVSVDTILEEVYVSKTIV